MSSQESLDAKVVEEPTPSDRIEAMKSKLLTMLHRAPAGISLEWALADKESVVVILAAIKHLVDDGVCELYRDENQTAMICLEQRTKMEREKRDG